MTTAAPPVAVRPVPEPTHPVPPAVAVPHLRLLRHEPDPDGPSAPAPARAGRAAPPVPADLRETAELRRRAHQVLYLLLEVLDGRRPLAHLSAHLDERALRYVRAALGQHPRGRPPTRLTSLHVYRPRADAVEVAAVHRAGGRARALAARFEGRPDDPRRWRCVTLRLI